MIPQTHIHFSEPVTVDLRILTGPRPRVIAPGGSFEIEGAEHEPVTHEFTELPLHVHFDGAARRIYAHLPPMPRPLEIYGPEDFPSAAADSMEDHEARVLQILGSAPAIILQALIDGTELPELPHRVPRSIRNWQARAVLKQMGLFDQVEALIEAMPDPDRMIVREAWEREDLARQGPTVTALAAALGMSEADVDALFINAGNLKV